MAVLSDTVKGGEGVNFCAKSSYRLIVCRLRLPLKPLMLFGLSLIFRYFGAQNRDSLKLWTKLIFVHVGPKESPLYV